jgi:hypothetical protein
MRRIHCVWFVPFLLLLVRGAEVRAADEKERAVVKKLLSTTIQAMERKVKDDKDARAELTNLKDTPEDELNRMAEGVKKNFKFDRLTPKNAKEAERLIKKAIDMTKADDLKRMLKKKSGKELNDEVRPKFCWIFGCD